MEQMMKTNRKRTIQLTSIIDLLFIMIFISLVQAQTVSRSEEDEVLAQEVQKNQKTQIESMSVNAVFHFYRTPQSPDVATGTYVMNGSFHPESGQLQLGALSWINQPEGYGMVPLNGKIDSSYQKFTGRIEYPGCEEFTLWRVTHIPRSKISGEWEGTYLCSQGETGLTLTIQ
jgi:hypothetical protein